MKISYQHGNSPSQPMAATPRGGGYNCDQPVARSYTEHRIGEQDFFESIIKKTENQLINATTDNEGMSTAEISNMSAGYNKLHNSVYNQQLDTNWTALPVAAPDMNIEKVLNAPISSGPWESGWLNATSTALADGISRIQIVDPGEVVAFLPPTVS